MRRTSALGGKTADLEACAVKPRRLAIASVGTQVAELVPRPEERADFFGETDGIEFLALFRVVPIDREGIAAAFCLKWFRVGKREIDDLGRRLQVFLDM